MGALNKKKDLWKNHYGLGNLNGEFLKKGELDLPYDPAVPFLGIYLKKPETRIEKIHAPLCSLLLTVAKIWKQPKCPSGCKWIKKLQCIYTMEYYLAMPFATARMDLESIMLSDISQPEEDKYYLISLMCGI